MKKKFKPTKEEEFTKSCIDAGIDWMRKAKAYEGIIRRAQNRLPEYPNVARAILNSADFWKEFKRPNTNTRPDWGMGGK